MRPKIENDNFVDWQRGLLRKIQKAVERFIGRPMSSRERNFLFVLLIKIFAGLLRSAWEAWNFCYMGA